MRTSVARSTVPLAKQIKVCRRFVISSSTYSKRLCCFISVQVTSEQTSARKKSRSQADHCQIGRPAELLLPSHRRKMWGASEEVLHLGELFVIRNVTANSSCVSFTIVSAAFAVLRLDRSAQVVVGCRMCWTIFWLTGLLRCQRLTSASALDMMHPLGPPCTWRWPPMTRSRSSQTARSPIRSAPFLPVPHPL